MTGTHQSIYKKLICILFFSALCGIVLFFSLYIIHMIKRWDYPVEYRDGALFKLVQDFADGINPYSTDYLTGQPEVVVDSGFINVFPAVLLVKLFDMPAPGAIWITNLIYVVLAVALFAKILIRHSDRKEVFFFLQLSFGILWLLTYLKRQQYLVTRPDIFCVVLLLWIIYLVTQSDIKQVNLVLSAFLCVIIAFAKVHYAVITLSIMIYIVSRQEAGRWKKLVLFCCSGILFAIIVFILTQLLFPTYLSEWIPRIVAMLLGSTEMDAGKSAYVFGKLLTLGKRMFPLVLICFVSVIIWICKGRQTCSNTVKFLVINVIVNGLAFLFVGRHSGADYWYFYIMVVPTLALLAAAGLGYIYHNLSVRYAVIVLAGMGLCWLIPNMKNWYYTVGNADLAATNFEAAYAILDQYQSDKMYLSPALSCYSMDHDIYNYDYGDTFYLVSEEDAELMYGKIPFTKWLLPYTTQIFRQHDAYVTQMVEDISNREYSIIVLEDCDSVPYLHQEEFLEAIEENYRLLEAQEAVRLTQAVGSLKFYVPKE